MQRIVSKGPKLGFYDYYMLMVCYYWRKEIWHKKKIAFMRVGQFVIPALLIGFTYYNPNGYQDFPWRKSVVLNTARFMTTLTSLPFLANYLSKDRLLQCCGLDGLSIPSIPMIAAKFTVHLVFRCLLLVIFTIIVYPLTGLNPGVGKALVFIASLCLHQFAKSALGFFISAFFVSAPVADFCLSLAAIINLLFSGGIVSGVHVSKVVWWLRFLSSSYFTNVALYKNQFNHWPHPEELSDIMRFNANERFPLGIALFIVWVHGTSWFVLACISFVYNAKTRMIGRPLLIQMIREGRSRFNK